MGINKRLLIWNAVAIAAFVLLAMGTHATTVTLGSDGLAPVKAVTKTVKAVDDAFSPKTVTIAKGSRIKWVNKGDKPHTTTSKKGLWDDELSPGDSYTRRFKKTGTFLYYCSWHSDMTGKIVVTT